MRGRPAENIIKKMKYKLEFEDSIWHYDLNKYPNGPYLVEIIDSKFDKLEKLYNKLERLQKPKYHENGRKKRTTKADRIKMETAESAYWKEHYKLFPEDIPKKRGRRKKKSNV
jgi:hypothetical protein